MERQLLLLDVQPEWHLDEHTREVGRAGIREARAALRAALRQVGDLDAEPAAHHPVDGRHAA